jgi:hypothetical protein
MAGKKNKFNCRKPVYCGSGKDPAPEEERKFQEKLLGWQEQLREKLRALTPRKRDDRVDEVMRRLDKGEITYWLKDLVRQGFNNDLARERVMVKAGREAGIMLVLQEHGPLVGWKIAEKLGLLKVVGKTPQSVRRTLAAMVKALLIRNERGKGYFLP